jgi:group II intron reverse transcriptase/maturase
MDLRWWLKRPKRPVHGSLTHADSASAPDDLGRGQDGQSEKQVTECRSEYPRRRRLSGREAHPAFTADALRRAWRQVRAKGGGPGVDGVDIRSFEADLEVQLAGLGQELASGMYRPRGVRRVLIPKPHEGLRSLAVWALRDRVAQRAVYNYLEPVFEPLFLGCSHGFRPGRSVQTAVSDLLAARDRGLRWVLDADIKDCFDEIDVNLLVQMVRRHVKDKVILRLLDAWLNARILTAAGQVRAAGAAQGGVLSPLLCNIYLHPFDEALTSQGLCLVRYADDLVVPCRRRREAETAGEIAQRILATLHLEINRYKTQVVHFDEGFKFLGVFFLRNEHFWL